MQGLSEAKGVASWAVAWAVALAVAWAVVWAIAWVVAWAVATGGPCIAASCLLSLRPVVGPQGCYHYIK